MKYSAVASVVLSGLVLTSLLGSLAISKASAESGVGKDVFKIVVSLYGITNSTKDIVTIAKVADSTKVKLYNSEDPNSEGSDKVSYVLSFPGVAVDDGQPYSVCTVGPVGLKFKCEHGNNSPLNRPEFVDINVSENSSKKGK